MEFTLNINMDNAAFEIDPQLELAALLEKVMQKVLDCESDGEIYDTNGNMVGEFQTHIN